MMLTPERLAELRKEMERNYLCWRNPDVRRLFEYIDAQQERIAEWETLRDPNVLHANLLRGIPAKLSADQLLHIAGDKYQAMAARIAELEAQLNRIKALADCATVQTWLELPDADKARWFAVTGDRDFEQCKHIRKLEALQERWLIFGKAMQKAGSELPRNLISDTEALITQEEWPEDASDYASRIAVIGQNGNDGLHYPEETP